MAVIGQINTIVSATTKPFTAGLNRAAGGLRGFGSRVTSALSVLGGLAVAFRGVASASQLMSQGFAAAAQQEQNTVAFTTLLASANKAKSVLQDVSDFAASTPFQLPELTDAAKSLAAFGFDAEDIVPNLRRLGDISAGLGQPISEIAEIYGKARVQGRLFGEDINQLTGRGIPIIGELAKQFGVAESEVKKLVSEGKVGFPELQTAFESMTNEGGKFAGLMEAQSGTLAGLWSTLKDNISFVFRDISQGLIDAFDFKTLIADGIDFARNIASSIGSIVPLIKQTATIFNLTFLSIFDVAKTIFSGIFGQGKLTFEGIRDNVLDFLIGAEFAFKNVGPIAELMWEKIKLGGLTFWEDTKFLFTTQLPEVFRWFADNAGNIFKTLIDFDIAIFRNLGENIRAIWEAVLNFFRGEGFNIDWTPLTEGFESQIGELPKISERELTDIEKGLQSNIDTLGGNLQTSFEAFREGRLKELLPKVEVLPPDAEALSDTLGQTIKDSVQGGIEGAVEGPAALQRGSAEAFSAILSAQRGGNGPIEEVAKTGQKQLSVQEAQLSILKNLEKNFGADFIGVTI